MSRDLEDVLREIGELSNIHADRKKLRANLRERPPSGLLQSKQRKGVAGRIFRCPV